jgi:outer membrane immunogenic protein
MRRRTSLVLGLRAFILLSGGTVASAAGLTPALYDWNGFYAGAHAGGAWDHRDASIFNTTAGAFLVSGSTQASGVTGGGQIGFNYALSPHWIAGFEADISAADLQGSEIGATGYGKRDNKIDSFGTLRGRLGYAWNEIMFYCTGGFAWANEQMTRTQQIGTINQATPGTVESSSTAGSGWAAGLGLEWGFAPNWSAKFEYLHLDIGSQSFTFPLAMQRIDATARMDVVRVGLNYRFDWSVRGR